MKIGGFQRFSLIDYPGKTAAVVFAQGCNFRCPYCHNPELVLPRPGAPLYDPKDVLAHLERRRGALDAVVITGGEPTLQGEAVDAFAAAAKRLGCLVKLDTNGSNPQTIARLLSGGLVDFIAMDLKAPLDKYHLAAGVPVDTAAIEETMRLIRASGVEHAFRTTFAPALLTPADLDNIRTLAGDPRRFTVQPCITPPDKPLLSNYPQSAPFA